MRLYHLYEFVVDHVPECVVRLIVEVDVLECVDIEVHLVVRAQSVMVYAEHCHVGKDVIYRGNCYLGSLLFLDCVCHHIR